MWNRPLINQEAGGAKINLDNYPCPERIRTRAL